MAAINPIKPSQSFIPDISLKESKLDRISRMATIIIGEAFLLTGIIAAIGVACSNPASGTVLLVAAVGLTIILLKEFVPKLIPHLPEKVQKVAYFIMGSINEAAAVLLSAAIYVFGAVNFDPDELPPDTKRVTLLVHGFLHNRSGWFYLNHRLSEENLGPVFTLNLGTPFHHIEHYAEVLKNRIDEIKELSGNENLEFDLIGHSMGGVVSVECASQINREDSAKIKRIFTMGSPLRGTPIGFLGVGCPCAEQMSHGSEFLKDLEEKGKKLKEDNIKLYHFGYGADLVVPADYTHLDKQFYKFYPHLGHLSAMYSQDNADDIVRILKQDSIETA